MDYPEEWNELPKHERRKKIKALKREQQMKAEQLKKIKNWTVIVIVSVTAIFGITQLTKKSPEQLEFEKQVETVSLDGRVEEFEIEGRDHVPASTAVDYQTNPPTSGSHLAQAKEWGIYDKEIDDKAAVHSMEHGGIWISYKDLSTEEIQVLEDIGKQNSLSTLISPRQGNDNKIVVTSWGKMMKLDGVDKALIQKYIDTYKNQSPEKLAR